MFVKHQKFRTVIFVVPLKYNFDYLLNEIIFGSYFNWAHDN